MENIIFRFVLEEKKEVACNACEESKMEEFSELFDGEKRLDPELNSEFFPFHSVTFRGKYFSIFVFPPVERAPVVKIEKFNKILPRDYLPRVDRVTKSEFFLPFPYPRKIFLYFLFFSKGTSVSVKKKRKKKHFKNRRESKNWKKKKFCFPTDTSTYIESRLESLKKKPEEEFNDEIKIKIEIFFSTTL